jgi:hypothetical protein
MGNYMVQQGDCLSSIAKEYGFADYQLIFQHPANAEFRKKRPNPNIICAGDLLFVPDVRQKVVLKGTDQNHKFVLKQPRAKLRLCLKDDAHQPYANTKYRLRVGSDHWDGNTNSDGMVERAIPANATEGEITLFPTGEGATDPGYSFALQLGDLDPVDEMSGVDSRLINLGFGPGDASESLSDEDRQDALKAFQSMYALEVTGELTDESRSKLQELHDGE